MSSLKCSDTTVKKQFVVNILHRDKRFSVNFERFVPAVGNYWRFDVLHLGRLRVCKVVTDF